MSIPPVRWCQRKDKVLLKVDVADVEKESLVVTLDEHRLNFSCKADSKRYSLELEFFKDVVTEGSKWHIHGKATEFWIKKKVEESWPQLTKSKAKHQWLTIDWSRWVDSDDEGNEELDDFGAGGYGGNFGGGGGGVPDFGNMNFDDMPDLEDK
eukprot:TRINITY_DN334_c0_g2_i1.p1 TRINITY_DN334_c0_g2~~TRINITY_DN334_c0_g2_i1.p1  ORF type:complete len:153 (-),score=37.01 TRINITY_DN334_c0_g2_i1:103-561(-)